MNKIFTIEDLGEHISKKELECIESGMMPVAAMVGIGIAAAVITPIVKNLWNAKNGEVKFFGNSYIKWNNDEKGGSSQTAKLNNLERKINQLEQINKLIPSFYEI